MPETRAPRVPICRLAPLPLTSPGIRCCTAWRLQERPIMTTARRILVAVAVALAAASPAFADGKKGRQPFVAPPVPPLRVPVQAPPALPPPIEI